MSEQENSEVCVVEEPQAVCEIDYALCCGGLSKAIETLMFQVLAGGSTNEGPLTPFANDIHERLGQIQKLIHDRTETSEVEVKRVDLCRRLLKINEEQNRLRREAKEIERQQLELSKPAPSCAQPDEEMVVV